MRQHKTTFVATVDGQYFPLFSILEKPNGDLIIISKSASRWGFPHRNIEMLEYRYSIHVSPKSPTFTTIKYTANLSDGQHRTSVAITDAVKCRTGFAPVFVELTPNPSLRSVRLSESDNENIVQIADYRPRRQTLHYGVFVGAPTFCFPVMVGNIKVVQHTFKQFGIVVLSSLFEFPSASIGGNAVAMTLDPNTPKSREDQLKLQKGMHGQSPGSCLRGFRQTARHLAKRYLHDLLDITVLPGARYRMLIELGKLGPGEMKPLKLDGVPQSIRRRTWKKPPNPR